MPYRDDVVALSARYDALAGEVAHKTRELEESRRLLDQAQARAKLPVLDNLRVASPCSADWNQMTGDDRTRHCGDCNKNVYNLSGMTRDEAEALIVERNGDLCVRYFQRHDGTILLADCTVGVKRKNRRRWIAAGAATLLAGSAVATNLPRKPPRAPDAVLNVMLGEAQAPPRDFLMGRISATPAPPPSVPTIPSDEGSWTAGAVAPLPVDPRPAPRTRPAHVEKKGKLIRPR